MREIEERLFDYEHGFLNESEKSRLYRDLISSDACRGLDYHYQHIARDERYRPRKRYKD
jgi:hypothetical protein